MVQDTCDLTEQRPDVLGALRDLDVQQLLDGQGKALLVRHHGNVIQSVEVRQGLHVGLIFDQLLGTTMKQTDVGVRADNLLAIELQNQPKHTVSSRMLGSEVDRVVTDLPVDPFGFGLEAGRLTRLLRGPLVGEMCEAGIRRDQTGRLVAGGLGMVTREGGRYRTGSGNSGGSGDRGGAETEPFGRIARQASEGSSHPGERRVD